MKRALLVANGEIKNYSEVAKKLDEYTFDCVICCDGGVNHLEGTNIIPNYIVGDFDSAQSELVDKYKAMGCEIDAFPVDKDFTDSELGINKCIQLGCEEIVLIGGIGDRLDHTISNLNLGLLALSNNSNLIIIDEINTIYTVMNSVNLENKKGYTCSIIPISLELEGITTTGLKYPLNNERICLGQTRPISNVIIEDKAEITINKGLAHIILSNVDL